MTHPNQDFTQKELLQMVIDRLDRLEEKLDNKLDKSEFYKVLGLVATGAIAYITKYVKEYLEVRKANEEDKLLVRKEENTIANSIDYVSDVFPKEKEKRPDLTKIELALEYIQYVEPKVYSNSGKGRLEMIIKRKVKVTLFLPLLM